MPTVWRIKAVFLSTPSGWRATYTAQQFPGIFRISIHALRVEGDLPPLADDCKRRAFLSTPSGWRATEDAPAEEREAYISIHALRVEGDPQYPKQKAARRISIHALRVEGDVYPAEPT